ncbi:MAG: urease subunit beta [Gammaproteobacteria bacterium]|nr:urease subunit beta [Gammaproteobacteria bacterium]
MMLTPTEQERLTIFTAAELARRHTARGIRLSAPEAIAYISDELLMCAREGRSVADLMGYGSTLLTTDDVLPGVADLVSMIQVEGMFPDGAKMITIHEPIRPGKQPVVKEATPGEVITPEGDIELNARRNRVTVEVKNTGDRPVQIGSHYHFFEVNKALEFDREAAFGMRLDIPAGTSKRFEPGESKQIELVAIGGSGEVSGFNNLTNGSVHSDSVKTKALETARQRGFRGA